MKKFTLKKIVVCYDGSKYSNKALLKAISIAATYGAKLNILHVIDNTIFEFFDKKISVGIIMDSNFGESIDNLKQRTNKILLKKLEFIKNNNIDYEIIVLEGNPSHEIIHFSKKKKIDLIVIGARGLGKISQFLLGSISNQIVNSSPCSVLIIK